MPSPSSSQRARTLRLMRSLAIGGLLAASVVVAGCGSSGSAASSGTSAASSDDARDAARLKLNQCLRQQGINVSDGGGGGAQLSEADREKRRIAIQGPCKEFRAAVGGNLTDEQRQEFQDAFTKFAACMRQNGVDLPDPSASGGGGPGGGGRGVRRLLDQDDPKIKAATAACQDELPQRGQGGPRGAGATAQ